MPYILQVIWTYCNTHTTINLWFFFFLGTLCDDDINECAQSSPCRNGGTCRNTRGSYICDCPNGYEGRQCEINHDDCDPSKFVLNTKFLRLFTVCKICLLKFTFRFSSCICFRTAFKLVSAFKGAWGIFSDFKKIEITVVCWVFSCFFLNFFLKLFYYLRHHRTFLFIMHEKKLDLRNMNFKFSDQ